MSAGGEPIFQGWLTKRGAKVTSWKRRWFILSQEYALSYREGERAKALRAIPITAVNELVGGAACGIAFPCPDMDRCFGIDTNVNKGGRIFFVFGESVEQVVQWKCHLWVALMKRSDAGKQCDSARQRAAQAVVKFLSTTPSAIEHVVGAGGISALAEVSRAFPSCKDLYTDVLQLIGNASAKTGPGAVLSSPMDTANTLSSMPAAEPEPAVFAGEESSDDEDGTGAAVTSSLANVIVGDSEEGAAAAAAAASASTASAAPVLAAPAPTGHGQGQQATSLPSSEAEAQAAVDAAWRMIEEQCQRATPIPLQPVEDRKDWQVVRVFVSSTFADMFSEREILMRHVFPKLHIFCEPRRIRLIECDLRWGVPKDSTSETVFRTCLSELDRCQADNGNAFFINLLSERYGWVPVGDQLPASVAEEYAWVPLVSITHMEILHGAYRTANPNAAFFLRDPAFTANLPAEFVPQFVDTQPLSKVALASLKTHLREKFPNRVFDYSCTVGDVEESTGKRIVQLKEMDKFAQDVHDFLTMAIERQYPLSTVEVSETEREAFPHDLFASQRTRVVVGVEEEVAAILSYIEQPLAQPGLMYEVKGPFGSGRATVMSAAYAKIKAAGYEVLFHSAQASRTMDPDELLANSDPRSLMLRLQHVNNGRTENNVKCSAMLEDWDKLDEKFVVIVDDFTVMSTREMVGRYSRVFPFDFSKSLRVIISTSDKTEFELQNPRVTSSPPQLSKAQREALVAGLLGLCNKRLDPTQMELLVTNEGSSNPFWLTLACQELRVFGVFETVTARIRELAPNVEELLAQVLHRVLGEDDSGHVATTLAVLACNFGGITEQEVREVVGSPNACRGPKRVIEPLSMAEWATINYRIRPFIVEVGGGCIAIINHTARQVVLRALSASRGDVEQQTNTLLANYFESHPDDMIRINRFPFYLQQTGDHARMIELLRGPSKARISQVMFRKLLDTVRCREMFMIMRVGAGEMPVPERMCMGCGPRTQFANGRVANYLSCCFCGWALFTENSRPSSGHPKNLDLKSGEKPVYRCRKHADYLHTPNSVATRCFVCKMLLGATSPCYAVLMCRSCGDTMDRRCAELL